MKPAAASRASYLAQWGHTPWPACHYSTRGYIVGKGNLGYVIINIPLGRLIL